MDFEKKIREHQNNIRQTIAGNFEKACDNSVKKAETEGKGELTKEQESKIAEFIKIHKNIDDSDFHKFVESLGIDPHEAEEVVYRLLQEKTSKNKESEPKKDIQKSIEDTLKKAQEVEDKISGGLSDNKTCEEIAKKHKVSVDEIMKELKMGISVEKEHTTDKKLAKEIAKDHLMEDPKYYTKLKTIE